MDEPVARYFDKQFQLEALKILPGQYYAAERDIMIVTVLGSCVSACLWDRTRQIGGMNHFMLPGAGHSTRAPHASQGPLAPHTVASVPARLGVYAMEVLINQMLKLGAVRGNLVAKVFGGGSVLEGMDAINIGDQNSAFVLAFLREEGIPVVAQDLQDVCPRKVYFFPRTGKVLVKRLGSLRNDTLKRREREYLAQLERPTTAGQVEIFTS